MFGLAAVAAMALMAFVGVGSASAVTLCEENVSTGCKSHVNSGGTIEFTAEDSIKLTGPFGITLATCTESRMRGTTSSTGTDSAAAMAATLNLMTFGNCNRLVTVGGSGGTLTITESGSAGNGTVSSSGWTVLIHEIPAPFPSTCAYGTEKTDIGKLTSSAAASTLDMEGSTFTETENCPNGTWSGHYVSTGTVIRAIAHS